VARQAIAAGDVRVNGRRVRKSRQVFGGDVVTVPDELGVRAALAPNPSLDVPVLYEDAAVIAIDKPAGMASHALHAAETDTAANFLLARYPELAAVGSDREPGVVHRLDTDTSGVLLVARTAPAYAELRRQFSLHHVQKEYLALVHGDVPAAGAVRTAIAHDRHNRRKMRVHARAGVAGARPALTRYRPLERLGTFTVLAVEIATGVMHQIRVHLASIGHPIAGDVLYGGERLAGAPARHLLHAAGVTFAHPESGRRTTVSSPPPAELTRVIDELRAARRGLVRTAGKARGAST
jgi:23S rRNA pseudouridine1911/1915/1917 synthase